MLHRRSTFVVAVVVTLAVMATGCGAGATKDDSGDGGGGGATTTAKAAAASNKFGTLDSPCGKGDGTAKVKADEAGGSPDTLRIGVANDRENNLGRAGLLQELWDASVAFAGWCNAQGGIEGLKIDPVDLDGHVIQIEQAMSTACTGTFAMVGGGWAQDNIMFSGKDGSDFHKCKLIAFPAFAVSTQLTEGNGQIQAAPNPAHSKPDNWIRQLVKLYPEEMKKTTVVYGTLDSIRQNADQVLAVGKTVKGFGALPQITYDAIGQVDWSLVATQVKQSGATAASFVGEPTNFGKFAQALHEQGWKGVVFADANQYDPVTTTVAGPDAVEGVIVRSIGHPFEEADKWPATKQLLDIVKQYGPKDAKVAGLSVQSFSSWLLFAQSAKKCLASGKELSRDCVLDEAFKVTEWNAGGLHATDNPSTLTPSACSMLIQAKGGKWTRLDPKPGSKDYGDDGFDCGEVVKITGDFGTGNIDPSRKH